MDCLKILRVHTNTPTENGILKKQVVILLFTFSAEENNIKSNFLNSIFY